MTAKQSTDREWPALIVCFFVTFSVAAIGSQFMPDAWFRDLVKPSFNPADAVFGPVWTILYAMMTVALWLVWRRRHTSNIRAALIAFIFQLLLNGAWSWLFFGQHQIGWALVDIVLLWFAIATTILLFRRHSRTAGALLIPYLCLGQFRDGTERCVLATQSLMQRRWLAFTRPCIRSSSLDSVAERGCHRLAGGMRQPSRSNNSIDSDFFAAGGWTFGGACL